MRLQRLRRQRSDGSSADGPEVIDPRRAVCIKQGPSQNWVRGRNGRRVGACNHERYREAVVGPGGNKTTALPTVDQAGWADH